MPPKPNNAKPTEAKPVLTKLEQDAINQAQNIKDTESEEYKLTIRKELRELKKTMQEEEKLMAFFQQEREKINYNWIIAKKDVEDRKSEFINKEREIEDLKENHIVTLNLYKQKIKHLLFQNQGQQSELRKDVEITLKQLEEQHRIKERELKTDVRSLHVNVKQQELSNEDYKFALKAEHDRKRTELRQDFELQVSDLKKKYDEKIKNLRKEMEEYRMQTIKNLEQKKEEKIKRLVNEHTKKYSDIKTYYTEITATNLDLIKQLRHEIGQLQVDADADKKLLGKIEKEKKDLIEPTKALEVEIKKLQDDIKKQDQIMAQKDELKAEIDKSQQLFRDLEYQYEVKLQSYKYKEKEKNRLFEVFNNAVYAIHQKSGLNNLILEKKLTTINEDMEVKDLQLNEVLKAAHIDPRALGAIQQSIEEVEAAKNDLINELQNKLQEIRKAHSHMVKAYEGKLSEFVIPVEELGFDPLVPTNTQ